MPDAKKRRPFTPDEIAFMRRHYRAFSLRELAAKMGRGHRTVNAKLWRLGLRRRRRRGTLTQRDVCLLLGLTPKSACVRYWLDAGLLRGHQSGHSNRLPWVIYPADFVEFLDRYPDQYDYALIPRIIDGRRNWVLDHARRLDPLAGLLTLKQASRLLGLKANSVRYHVRMGYLPAVRFDMPNLRRQVFIPREAVEQYRTPERRREVDQRLDPNTRPQGARSIAGALR